MQASKAFVVLLVLSAVSLTLGDYCMPITNTNTANSVCGTLPAATCTPTATSVDGTTYTAANYGTYVNSWAAQKSTICPRNPRLVDDYPLQRFCPDLCTSNYTCQANAYTNFNTAPMCYHLCLQCFDVATCTSWSQNPGNVTRSGVATGCYSSWTHMGADTLQVNDVTPTWGYLKGNQKVVITGCGFTTYSEATCVWGNWHSTNALIVDDNTIHCWTPKVSFVTVPTTTSFQIIFDGTPAITRKLPDFWWGPMITTITPTQVYVAGGVPLTINGFGFSEWTAATTNVTIDGVACTGVSITDTAITCSIPQGSINQNAIVDVYFNGNKYYFAHTYPNTLHYGPLLSSINPTCGHVKGGDTITITGSLFDDPVLNNPRVEFFINGGWWWGSNAVHTGSTITVQTPVPANGFDAWDQNVPITVYGGSPSYAKVPGTASFHYGALLFTVTPTVGYIDGGETVSITGCAFRDYNNSQVTGVFLTTGLTNSLCNLNTVNIVSDNLITCTSVSSTTCFQTGLVVNVGFNDGRQVPAGSQTNVQNSWWWGPKLTVTSLTPSRGPINFLNPVTVTGYKIGRSTNTLFATNQATFTAPAVTVNATVGNGQTTLAFSAPTYQWQGVSTVSYSWETCGTYPDVTPQYKWGPSCSSVTPTFGYLGGQQTVTLNGVGFQDQDWNLKTLRARFCTPSAGCNWEQLGFTNVTVTSATTATVSTPNFALAPRNGLGANRYFGDVATVSLFFDTIGVNETQVLSCGSYRYGPIVTGLNPRKGPIGPRADHSPNTAVTVLGAGFQDPLLTNNIRVAFGNIHGESATTTTDTSITVKTLWGARANTDKSVYVYFDTCNTTSSATSFTWGPQVFNVTPIWGYNAGTNGTNTMITIQGARFQEWYYNGYTDAVCVIDNVYGTNTVIVDDNTITCTVPVRPFGTQAVVQVVFGKTCRGEWDWSQVVQSPTDVYYKPLITGITPTVGYTSGGQTVTISGLGLGNWPNYNCYFGHYKSPSTTSPSSLDGSVVCTTPSRREDFNTDVLVHVQLAGDDTVANIGYDFKVWGPTYHYGPICATVSPTRGYFNHDPSYQITLSGVGFADAQWFNQTQPYVLVDGQNVTVVSANDGQVVVNNLTNANSCQQNRTITMWWDKQTQVISCPIYTHGPMVTSSTPDLGWAGDTVTIMGDFLDDPVIYNQLTNVQVTFGSATGTTLSVSQFQITVTAPVNAWLFDAPVAVAWSGYNKSCSALKATNFHYGPIINSITPTFGYVWGRQPVVINGRGFTCCGLSAGTTNCRFAHTEITQDTTTVNGDTQISCSSLGRGSEVTSSATATTTKVVGLSFNGTARILDTDTNAGGRQSTVTYYYGPLVNSVTPTFGRIRGGTTITILGAGFNDPYFMQPAFGALEPVVRFTQSTGGSGVWYINATAHDDLSVTAATLDYIHKCGDNDVIALQFYTNSSLTDRFIIPTDNRLTHHYGPLVTSINPSWGYVRGGDTVTITATQLDEWTGRKVRVLFANRESNDADTEFTVTAASTYTAVTPRGSFLHSGPISLILDYKNDALTTASYWWHWHPYTSSVSQAWGIEGGGFQTTVYGGGFCEYELVTCNFGSTQGSQSDVAYDDRIVCSVPTAAPGTNTISLTFCDYWADCQASYAGSADNVAAFGFTHVGVTNVAPVSGPWVGNTLVTITGTGFDQFTSISVSFGSLAAVSPAGNTTTATQILVYTPAAPAAQTVQVFLTLTYTFSDGVTEQFTIPDRASTPFNFRYDYPAITDIAPATTDVDVTLPVTLTGLYFNGGVLGNIRCYWNVPTKTGTTTLTVNPTAKTDTTLTCAAPTVANGIVLLGGSTVSVSWDGTRKSNIVGFAYTQNPAVTGITPTQGPQYGATRVTVFGNNFNTGVSVLCKFSDQVSASVDITYSSTTTTTTTSTTGATNTTTTGTTASTTGAANTTTTTTGAANTTANGTAPVSARNFGGREVRGTADAIVCLSPRSLSNSFPATAKVEVSLDGGVTWTTTTTGVNSFTYQEGFTSTSEAATENSTSNTNALVPLISMVFALVIFVVVF